MANLKMVRQFFCEKNFRLTIATNGKTTTFAPVKKT